MLYVERTTSCFSVRLSRLPGPVGCSWVEHVVRVGRFSRRGAGHWCNVQYFDGRGSLAVSLGGGLLDRAHFVCIGLLHAFAGHRGRETRGTDRRRARVARVQKRPRGLVASTEG